MNNNTYIKMNKDTARKTLTGYLDNMHIEYRYLDGCTPIEVGETDVVYFSTYQEMVIGHYVETTVKFEPEGMYVLSYPCQPVIENAEQSMRASRIISFINMNLDYNCNTLYEHTFTVDEENGDIFVGALIRYELFELYPEETYNHILNYSNKQMADICAPVLLYMWGHMDYDTATEKLQELCQH